MRKGKGKVIWTHPKGRFEVVEYEHHGFGGVYKTRECRMTLQKDARGLARRSAGKRGIIHGGIVIDEEEIEK